MIREDMLEMIYNAMNEAEYVVVAGDELDGLMAGLEAKLKELGVTDVFDMIDPIVSAMTALQAETTRAAYQLGWQHARRPELLVFKDGSTV